MLFADEITRMTGERGGGGGPVHGLGGNCMCCSEGKDIPALGASGKVKGKRDATVLCLNRCKTRRQSEFQGGWGVPLSFLPHTCSQPMKKKGLQEDKNTSWRFQKCKGDENVQWGNLGDPSLDHPS